jgi:hypothetical protein
MSLSNYKKLQREGPNKIGIKLPSLKFANFNRQAEILNLENTLARINGFAADAGWLMQSDLVMIQPDSTGISHDSPLIEAQFNKGNSSLHIKLVNNGQYSVVALTSDSIDDSDSIDNSQQKNSAYSEQELYVRNDLATQSGDNVANYRQWWQQDISGNNEGRWQVIAQQFMGFSAKSLVNSNKENAL